MKIDSYEKQQDRNLLDESLCVEEVLPRRLPGRKQTFGITPRATIAGMVMCLECLKDAQPSIMEVGRTDPICDEFCV